MPQRQCACRVRSGDERGRSLVRVQLGWSLGSEYSSSSSSCRRIACPSPRTFHVWAMDTKRFNYQTVTSQGPRPPLAECVWVGAKRPTSTTISTYHSACIRFAADDSKVRTKLSKTQRVHALSLHGENLTPKFGGRHPRSFQKRFTSFIYGGGGGQLHRLCHSQGGVALRCRLHRPALPSAAPPAFPSAGGVTLETSLSEALYPMCWVWTAAWKAIP